MIYENTIVNVLTDRSFLEHKQLCSHIVENVHAKKQCDVNVIASTIVRCFY